MHRLLVLYPEPADRAAFAEHYRSEHLDLARALPGLLDLRFSLAVEGEQNPYFAVFEADFPDARTFGEALASPEGERVQADVPTYATGGALVLHFDVET